ncbi:ATP-grasp domain-containing protein [Flavobacterium sp. DG1-102-2]|uniref:ATP-grasp domain-containing protein n=1 Tax=Flavobacterium sp. DG1-102-2 TaxID=3081663 RepID=UPI0029490613|nr:ATP-grasp domain-containing protein [Flavobacterium sp. DG1-102-2]MDV6167184.1 ATP-grasp domain-containing protein [Flavobacterium sp. DG1-102-2]
MENQPVNIFLINSDNSESGTLQTLPENHNLQIISDSDTLKLTGVLSGNEKVLLISESSIEKVLGCLPNDTNKRKAIEVLKDKYCFRELVKDAHYQIKKVALDELTNLNIDRKSVVKPLKGCFGTAVKIVDSNTDMRDVYETIIAELARNGSMFGDAVLSTKDFIVEDFIDGEEYAVDMFYNSEGAACIVNIYHHPLPKHEEYLHMIYYSSRGVHEAVYQKAKTFFNQLNKQLQVTDFAMHSEFKMCGDALVPIEINCMRYGGMGLGNLVYHSFNVDPYYYFLEGIEPDWQNIFKDIPYDYRFVYFIAYNAAGKDKLTHYPVVEKLRGKFTNIKLERLFDYQKQLAFGVYCLQENEENLNELLNIDFDDYFLPA